MQSGIDAAFSAGLYTIDLTYSILNYDLEIHWFSTPTAPIFKFMNYISAVAPGQWDFKAKNNSNG